MGFKKFGKQTSFADFVLKDVRKNNRCLQDLKNINDSLDWNRIESILMSQYTVGKSNEGANAYSPLVLFKCLLLQKWFRINSDPELESQIHPVKYAVLKHMPETTYDGVVKSPISSRLGGIHPLPR